jgi:hypothetical protein
MFKTNLQNLLNNALELFNKKNFFEAEKIYKQILEIDNKTLKHIVLSEQFLLLEKNMMKQ